MRWVLLTVTPVVMPVSGLPILLPSLPCYSLISMHRGKIGMGAVLAWSVRSFASWISSLQPLLCWEACLQHWSVNSFTKMTPTLPQSKAHKEKPPFAIVNLEFDRASVDRAANHYSHTFQAAVSCDAEDGRNGSLLNYFSSKKLHCRPIPVYWQYNPGTQLMLLPWESQNSFLLSISPATHSLSAGSFQAPRNGCSWVPGWVCATSFAHIRRDGCVEWSQGLKCFYRYWGEWWAQGVLFMPGPCSHAGCSGQAQRPVSKGFGNHSTAWKNGARKEKLGLSPYVGIPAGCKYLKVVLLNQEGF